MSKTSGDVPKHFIVFVPGYMGSKLREKKTGKVVWVDSSSIPWNPFNWGSWLDWLFKSMSYPNEELEAFGIMDQIIFVPPWAKQQHYNRLITALREMGYRLDEAQCFGHSEGTPPYDEKDLNCYAFAYDWRQDNRVSAQQLGEAVARWRAHHPDAEVWIIAHSNGGMVARWYIEMEGGKEFVSRLILMGSPWDGTPKAMRMAFNGVDTLFRRSFNWFNIPQRTRDMVRTFPSIYQLIPAVNPFLRDAGNNPVDPFASGGWLLKQEQREMLLDGQRFNQALGTKLSAETLCIFGTRHLTPTSGVVTFGAANSWQEIVWGEDTEEGDGTIPTRSAAHPEALEKIPYPVSHGDIYVNDVILEKIKYELFDKYRQVRATVVVGDLQIIFEPEEDTYEPGAQIDLWATVQQQSDSSPVSGATFKVWIKWYQALPGTQAAEPTANPSTDEKPARLQESKVTPGRYEGSIKAPTAEGYYRLQCKVSAGREPQVTLEELIAVEAARDPSDFGAADAGTEAEV